MIFRSSFEEAAQGGSSAPPTTTTPDAATAAAITRDARAPVCEQTTRRSADRNDAADDGGRIDGGSKLMLFIFAVRRLQRLPPASMRFGALVAQ